MKRSHRLTLPALLALSLVAFGPVRADSILLKSGERLEGKVISENADSVTLEYRLTAKIKDTKIIAKSDIKEMIKLSPAQMEMEERGLRRILPTGDLLTAADYEAIIQDKLRTFVAKHPNTPEAAEAERIIATLSEEKNRVVAGDIKLQSRWLTAGEAKRDAYNIEAFRHRLAMNTRAGELRDDNFSQALREFDILRNNYGASTHFVEAIPEALDLLDKYEKRLVVMSHEQPIIAKQRVDGLKLIQGPELQLTKGSIDAEVKAAKEKAAAQKKDKVKWGDVYKYDLAAITEAQAQVNKERSELKALNLAALEEENRSYTTVLRYIAEEKGLEAEQEFARIQKDTVVNKKAYDATAKQITVLKDALKSQNKAAIKAAASMDRPATSAAEDDQGKNALAELLKKGREGKTPAADPAAPASDTTKAEVKKADDKKPAKPAAKPAAAPAAAAAPEPEAGVLATLSGYFPIIGGVLLVILLAALFLGKKKKGDE